DGDEEGVAPLAPESFESAINLAAGAGVEDLNLQPQSAGSRFHVSQRGLDSGTGRVDKHGHTSSSGHQFMQEFHSLRCQLGTEKIGSCQVAARPGEAGDKT